MGMGIGEEGDGLGEVFRGRKDGGAEERMGWRGGEVEDVDP